MFSITTAMNPSFFTLAVMTIAVRSFNDASCPFTVVVPMSSLSLFKEVENNEQSGENEHWHKLHCGKVPLGDDGLV
jgi:hypothetical protein